ncbi:hypothetical protein J22TS1_11610 [Siminovitchia terrae]|nr:hypothetical protein J22TS1_11610 [Siminovitchia terrae]
MDKGKEMCPIKNEYEIEGKCALELLALLSQEETKCAELLVISEQMMRRKYC